MVALAWSQDLAHASSRDKTSFHTNYGVSPTSQNLHQHSEQHTASLAKALCSPLLSCKTEEKGTVRDYSLSYFILWLCLYHLFSSYTFAFRFHSVVSIPRAICRVLPRVFRRYGALRVPKRAIRVNGQRYALML